MPSIHWLERELSRHIKGLDLNKGADLDGNGKIEGAERTDLNADGAVDLVEWQKFLGDNKDVLKGLGGLFIYYYTAGRSFRPDNPIHDLMFVESEHSSPHEIVKAYSIMEKILKKVKKDLKSADTPQKKLKLIYDAMKQVGINFNDKQKDHLFVDNINKKVLDRDTSSFVALAIAHELDWPVYLVNTPGHAFVRWDNAAGARINMDLGSIRTDKYYIDKFNISKKAIKQGVYLRSLNDGETISTCYRNRGATKFKQQRYEEAIEDFDEAIKLNPNDAGSYSNRGNAKLASQRHKEAIKDYDMAIALDPNSAVAYYNRGFAKEKLGRYEGAIKDYDEAIKFDPKDAMAYYNRGNAKMELGKYEEAIKDYDEAIRINPKFAKAHNSRKVAEEKLASYTVGHILIKAGPLWRYNDGDETGGYQISAGVDLKMNFPIDGSSGFAVGLMPEFAAAYTFIYRDDDDSWLTLMPNAKVGLEYFQNAGPGKSEPYRIKVAGGYAGRLMPVVEDDEYAHGWTASADVLFSLGKYDSEPSFSSNTFFGPSISAFHFPTENDLLLNASVQCQW